jgi:hypothetical protein
VGNATGEIGSEFDIGEHDLHGVRAPGPADAGLGPHGAGRAVAPRGEAEDCLLNPGR